MQDPFFNLNQKMLQDTKKLQQTIDSHHEKENKKEEIHEARENEKLRLMNEMSDSMLAITTLIRVNNGINKKHLICFKNLIRS